MTVVIKQVWDHCCRGSLPQRTFGGAVAPSVLPSGAAGLWPGQFLSKTRNAPHFSRGLEGSPPAPGRSFSGGGVGQGGSSEAGLCGAWEHMVKLAGSVGWAALGEMRLKVLLEEFEAELLTVALEHLGQGWGATEEDLHLALLLSSHLLEHLSPHGVGESRGRGVSLWTRSGTHPAGCDIMTT